MWCGVVWCAGVSRDRVACLALLNGVLVAWQVGLFGTLGYSLVVWLVGACRVVSVPCGVWCYMLLYSV